MARNNTLLLLLLIVITGCLGYKPRMSPDKPELLINEGDELIITCVSKSAFKLVFPETESDEDIITSHHDVMHEDDEGLGIVKRKFQRKSTVYGDTGWYGCVDESVDETDLGDYDDPNSSWIYVYVKSKEHLFAQELDLPHTRIVSRSDTAVLPCRPTSPELHVNLRFNFEQLELDDRVSYDPKRGFSRKHMTAFDSGIYICTIDNGIDPNGTENVVELEFNVIVLNNDKKLVKPVISDENLQHVTKGSELNITCTAEIHSDTNYKIHWTTPRETLVKKEFLLPSHKRPDDIRIIGGVLNIKNVTYDDEGEYVCGIETMMNGLVETRKYINVFDPENQYINLTILDTQSLSLKIIEYNPVIYKVYIDAHPQPIISWARYDAKGVSKDSDLHSDMHINVNSTKTTTQLGIDRVYKSDAGTYVLQAFHNETSYKRLNFTLEVLAVPSTILNNDDNIQFYGVNQMANFSCIAYNNPPSKIQISYSKCPHYPIMEYCETVELDSTTIQDLPTEKIVRVRFPAEYPGTLTCTACNERGCDTADLQIFLTDGLPNQKLGIVSDPEMVTANDDVTLTCMAPIYNSSAVEWQDNNYEPIRNSDRVEIVFANTTYTRRSILKIRDVHKSDEADYACISISSDGEEDRVIIHLEVHDPMEPIIKATNMNGSETELTVEEAHNIRLTCYSEGKPYPNTTWYKDGQPFIADGEQFIFEENNQELVIDYLTVSDSGEYKCVAKNRVSEAVVFQRFLVKGPTISTGWIVAIVAVLVLLVSLLIYFCIKVQRERRMRKQLIEVGLMHFEEGALDCINPELTVDDQADLLPYDRKWEFPRDKLKLGKQLGSGAFGVVMKAEARGILADESLTTVAVKMVHRNAEPAYIRALASELKIMVHLGKHLNVVNLLGACTNNIAKRELLVIVEYCRYGNLHNYLLRHREDFINQIDPESGKIDPLIGSEFLMRSTSAGSNIRLKYAALSFSRSLSSASDNGRSAPGTESVIYTTETQELAGLPNAGFNSNGSQPGWRSNYRGDYKDRNLKPICTQDLLSWAFQVARGMEYLCQRKVLHGDLAARNILLAENNVVKICDFGLAKTMYKDDNYQKKGNGPVPIKWMAVESIRDRVFSTQSDIWSFGIVLWEFFTLAETPYPGMKAETQYQRLIEGYRMEQPKYATKDIYNIMLQCWKAKPALRPTFSELVEDIGELLEEGVRKHYVDLNSLYIETIDEKHDYLKMMSAPDHNMLAGPQHDYVNCPQVSSEPAYLGMISPTEESAIFSPRPNSQDNTRFQFPSPAAAKIANANNSDGEDSPMLKKLKEEPELDEDNYLKPIDVQKKREEFTRQREAEKRKSEERSARASTDRDSGYCNTPKALELIDVKVETPNYRNLDDVDAPTMILKTPDEKYSWRQKNESRKPESFMNPSYVFVESSKPNQETL